MSLYTVLTVIPGGGGTSDVTCITDVSSIEYMRTCKYDETKENRYLSTSIILSPTYSIPPPQETHPTINLPVSWDIFSFVKIYFSSRGWGWGTWQDFWKYHWLSIFNDSKLCNNSSGLNRENHNREGGLHTWYSLAKILMILLHRFLLSFFRRYIKHSRWYFI